MRLLLLTQSTAKPAEAVPVSRAGKLYFKLSNGTAARTNPSGYLYTISVDASFGIPKNINDAMVMDGNKYVLSPIFGKRPRVQLTNSFGDNLFQIQKDNSTDHRSDCIVLWEIPNKMYENVTYELDGDVEIVAEGVYAKQHAEKTFTSPAPVLLVTGNCTLTWTGMTVDGQPVGQKCRYTGGEWEWVEK